MADMDVDELKALMESCGIETSGMQSKDMLEGMYYSLLDTGLFDGAVADSIGDSGVETITPSRPAPTAPPAPAVATTPSPLSNTMNNNAKLETAALEDDEMSEEHSAAIVSFCGITGADLGSATHYLEMMDWSVEKAVPFYMDNAATEKLTVPIPPPGRPFPTDSSRAAASGGGLPINPPVRPGPYFDYRTEADLTRDHFLGFGGGGGGDGHSPPRTRAAPQYDEDGVRVADEVQMRRLLSREASDGSEFGRADEDDVEWMFPPPTHLSFPGSLENAKKKATDECKLLLVNIQSHLEFTSHLLNRDTWVGETMESILRGNYVFWQRGHTSGDGKHYMRLYKIGEDDMPHVGIIDPRTGRKILQLTGLISQEDMMMRLSDTAEANPITKPRSHSQLDEPTSDDTALELAVKAEKATAQLASSGSGNSGGKEKGTVHRSSSESLKEAGCSTTSSSSSTFSKASLSGGGEGVATISPAAALVEEEQVPNFGPVPPEPDASCDETALVISLRFEGGVKPLTRRYTKDTQVKSLYATALAHSSPPADSALRNFELTIRLPGAPKLATQMESTLGECNLDQAVVFMRWIP